MKDIGTLEYEHRIMKRPFIFNKVDYVNQVMQQMKYIQEAIVEDYDIKVERTLAKSGDIISLWSNI